MQRRTKAGRLIIACTAGLMTGGAALLLHASPLLAAEPAAQHTTLHDIARQFQKKIGAGLDRADEALSSQPPSDRYRKAALRAIPDGEPLLLTATLRESYSPGQTKLQIADPLTAIKQGDSIYLSLTDFNYIAGFNVKIDAEARKARGFYMREDQPLELDVAAGSIRLGDEVKTFNSDDVIIENDDFYVREETLRDWFSFSSDAYLQGQRIEITTAQQFPVQGQLSRQKRRNKPSLQTPVEKPRLVQKAAPISIPRADISLTQNWERPGNPNVEGNNYSSYSALTTNQLLDHEMSSYFSGAFASSRDVPLLQQARINFRKESEQNDLLGPLKARVYEFNDIAAVSIPFTGGSSIERGVRVSNQSERYSIDTQTNIEGDAQPGWDIELYRNQAFVAGTTVDQSGRYVFENVQLYAGDNRFRIVSYGLFGEQVEEDRLITVLPSLIGDIKGYYNLSLSQKDEITYRANQPDDEDRGTPRLVGRYDRRVNENLTLRGGLHTRETLGQRDNYFYTGAVSSLGATLLNADIITTSDGPFRASATARRNFGRHNASAGAEYLSADFSDAYITDQTVFPSRQSLSAALSGPFMMDTFKNVTYNTTARVGFDEDGRQTTNNEFGLSSSYAGFRFNNRVTFDTDSGSQIRPEQLRYSGSVSSRTAGYNWRGRIDYEVMPESEPELLFFDINKSYSNNIQGKAQLQHRFYNDLSEATIGATYLGEKARISPTISYDSEQNIKARVDVSFGLAMDPYTKDVTMSSRGLSNRSGLSVFAYLDKDGNGIFDGDDEPLQDVSIRAKQLNTELVTDENGNASNTNVRAHRVTDVVMEESSAFEPNWVSGYEGASVLLRPSETVRLEFPVLRGAEIDGTANIADTSGKTSAARSILISAITPDGKTVKSTLTPFDGFYILPRIPPGVYYLATDSSQSPTTAYRTPEKIVITPEGAQLYGKNITLTRGYNIPFTFTSANANPALERRTKILRPEDIAREDVYIRLGNYRSALAASLAWYKLKLQTRGWHNPLSPTDSNFDTIARDEKTGRLPLRLRPAHPLRMEEAALLCERLVDAGFGDCGVDVVTTYHDGTNAVAAGPVGSEG